MPTDETKRPGPRDVFLQLLAIATLYLSAIAFGTLLFQYINIYFPDLLTDTYYGYPPSRGSLRLALASLVIVFPVYVWVSWFLGREIKAVPEKGELKTRKWLLYFTLFATAVIVIGDLVTLVYHYLEGELTVRFILKVFTVLLIAGVIFGYYLWNLRMRGATNSPRMKFFVRGVIAVVALTTLIGFFMAGSPKAERLRRFDERRVGDLQSIQWQIVTFWQQKNRLPHTLDELPDPISGYQVPRDPQDKTSYEYRTLDDLRFELCAYFKTDSAVANSSYPAKTPMPASSVPYSETFDNWAHGIGRVCFERAIDPERYGSGPEPLKLR